MNRITEVELCGKMYALNYSAKAAQILSDRFDGPQNVFRAFIPGKDEGRIDPLTTEVFDNVLFAAETMMKYGAKYREIFDGVSCGALSVAEMETLLGQQEYLILYSAVLGALQSGARREVEVEEDPKNVEATQG